MSMSSGTKLMNYIPGRLQLTYLLYFYDSGKCSLTCASTKAAILWKKQFSSSMVNDSLHPINLKDEPPICSIVSCTGRPPSPPSRLLLASECHYTGISVHTTVSLTRQAKKTLTIRQI